VYWFRRQQLLQMTWLLMMKRMMHAQQLERGLQVLSEYRPRRQPLLKLLDAPALSPDHVASTGANQKKME